MTLRGYGATLSPERKAAYNTRQRKYRSTSKGKRAVRNQNLKKYGITPEQYDDLAMKQEHKCAACHQPETGRNQHGLLPLAVDHDHRTNKMRGLLCMRCNRSLGMLRDDPSVIEALLKYRKQFP